MPVYKRAARPTAASASDDPRDPQPSDNDFTVLFQRVSARSLGLPPRIERPKPAPKPPAATRSRPSPEARAPQDRPTPLVMAVPAADRVETVTVRPTIRTRLARVGALLALGCALGTGAEHLLRGQLGASSARAESSSPSPVAAGASLATEASDARSRGSGPSISLVAKGSALHPVHHHHAHHATVAPPQPGGPAAITGDAGQVDDLAAAMQTLTKAKEEVTIP